MKYQNWIAITVIYVGGAICLPVLMIGFELARQFGFTAALIAIALGNAILYALGVICARMSAQSGQTTVEHAERYLGKHAKALFAVVITLSMNIWFAIQAQMMAQDIVHMLPQLNAKCIAFAISALIIYCALAGIRRMEVLANIAVPLMLATMCVAVYRGSGLDVQTAMHASNFSSIALSLVLATSIAAVVDMPTFFRHALNQREALKATAATFLVGIPAVELMGAMLSHSTGSASLVDALYCFDGAFWKVWILIFILLAGWTTNNANLYSSAMSVKSLFSSMSDKKAIVYAGVVAALLSLCDILSSLELFLDGMGILVSSMGGVILAGFMMQAANNTINNLIVLVLGIAAGCVCMHEGGLITNIPIVDSLMVSMAGGALFSLRGSPVCRKN